MIHSLALTHARTHRYLSLLTLLLLLKTLFVQSLTLSFNHTHQWKNRDVDEHPAIHLPSFFYCYLETKTWRNWSNWDRGDFVCQLSALWQTKLLLSNRANTELCRSAAPWFTKTWLGEHGSDSTLCVPGFQLLWADGKLALWGKTRGGGICYFINEGWCTDVTVVRKSCSPHLETTFMNCKLYYLLWEFSLFWCLHPIAGLF